MTDKSRIIRTARERARRERSGLSPEKRKSKAKSYREAAEKDPENALYWETLAENLEADQIERYTYREEDEPKPRHASVNWDSATAFKKLFGALYNIPLFGNQPKDSESRRMVRAEMPLAMHFVIWGIGAFTLNAFITHDIGLGVVLVGVVWRELYARKTAATNYRQWMAYVIGCALPALTIMGTMWPFGLALIIHFLLWKKVGFFRQPPVIAKPESGDDEEDDDDEEDEDLPDAA